MQNKAMSIGKREGALRDLRCLAVEPPLLDGVMHGCYREVQS